MLGENILGIAEYLADQKKDVCVCDTAGRIVWLSAKTDSWIGSCRVGDLLFLLLDQQMNDEEQRQEVRTKLAQPTQTRLYLYLDRDSYSVTVTPVTAPDQTVYTIWEWEKKSLEYDALNQMYRDSFFYLFNHLKALEYQWEECQLDDTPQYEAAYAHMQQIRKHSYHLLRVNYNCEEYYAFLYHKCSIRTETVSFRQYFQEMISTCNYFFINQDKHLTLEMGNGSMLVNLESRSFSIALLNLLHNAVYFSHDGSDILVKAHQVKDHIIFSIENDGSGIPPEHLLHVFEPFYAYDPSQDGSRHMGLGLTVAKQIVEEHKGNIMISSKEYGTTVITVRLPAVSEEDADCIVRSKIQTPDDDFSLHRIFLSDLR